MEAIDSITCSIIVKHNCFIERLSSSVFDIITLLYDGNISLTRHHVHYAVYGIFISWGYLMWPIKETCVMMWHLIKTRPVSYDYMLIWTKNVNPVIWKWKKGFPTWHQCGQSKTVLTMLFCIVAFVEITLIFNSIHYFPQFLFFINQYMDTLKQRSMVNVLSRRNCEITEARLSWVEDWYVYVCSF